LKTTPYLFVNKMATRHYGYSREEFLSMTALDIRPEEDKEHFKNLDRSKKNDDLNYNKGVWRHRKKNGSLIYVEIIAHQIEFEGKKARIVLAHDVTERKAIEDKITV
jgi:PAS domain S-box-containing protein